MRAITVRRHLRPPSHIAQLHVGRATAPATEDFIERSPLQAKASNARLRVSERGPKASYLTVGQRGIGSPALWAKDMPRVDNAKELLTSYTSNFIQTAVNPSVRMKMGEKQAYVEALVLQEVMEDLDIPRECFVVSTLLGSNVLHPSNLDADERLSKDYVEKGVEITRTELGLESLDHVVCQIPEELALLPNKQDELMDKLQAACDALETLCSDGKTQSYGFALPNFKTSAEPLDKLVEETFQPLSEQFGRFSSLQLPYHLGSAIFPLPASLAQFRSDREMLLIGDRPLETMLSNGNPFHLKTYPEVSGEDVAMMLKTAFNLAIAVEKKYRETIRPEHEHLDLPPAEEVAWAHILANQHSQFDNLQVWLYIRETQIYPRVEAVVKEFGKHKQTEELAVTYSMVMRELLKCFTGSVELVDADREANMMAAWKKHKLLPSTNATIEEIAVMASLSSGVDVTLLEEQLPSTSSLPFTHRFSSEQFRKLSKLAQPFFAVE
ncbi:hypothetical protein PHYBOEH_000462 [Phytophthora boehmeriae]|uniref:NADP-dependent oxidoreductase domain-containing protein n=1 Tax=Phytophthora boehmeriae TaxID=109152 RepID=A0A8T1VAY0_9STRA|nr:hypothetical protein PHYBOEH_000462 [Phytophthora boehmeriae]